MLTSGHVGLWHVSQLKFPVFPESSPDDPATGNLVAIAESQRVLGIKEGHVSKMKENEIMEIWRTPANGGSKFRRERNGEIMVWMDVMGIFDINDKRLGVLNNFEGLNRHVTKKKKKIVGN